MFDWIIVGAGVHGCTIAHSLMAFGVAHHKSLRIIDPHENPLDEWNRRAGACGMSFLRSPAAHAVVPDFTGMLAWGRANGFDPALHTRPPYSRPSLELFQAHARAMIERSGLESCRQRGLVVGLRRNRGTWGVHLLDGTECGARRVVLAVGRGASLPVPDWATDAGGRAMHLFDPRYDRERVSRETDVTIVGGGVSAVHAALSCTAGQVRLVSRHPITTRQFDSDPCYIGPACMERYLSVADRQDRRRTLEQARHPGTIPADLAAELHDAVEGGRIEVSHDEILAAEETAAGRLRLSGTRTTYETSTVVFATGFGKERPGGTLVAELADGTAAGSALAVDAAGYPVPDPSLQWAPGLFVAGSLGEQELGPSAPNIVGAHNAAKRIISHVQGRLRRVPGAWRRYAPASTSSSSSPF